MLVQTTLEVTKITSMSVDHLAMSTSTEASRRRAVVIAPASLEPGKPYCGRQSRSHRDNDPKDQHTSTSTAVHEVKRKSEGSKLQTHG